MAPMYGQVNFDWPTSQDPTNEDDSKAESSSSNELTKMAFWYMMVLIAMLLTWIVVFFCLRIIAFRQKTRNSQQRRAFAATRQRQVSVPGEPTIYVSPANLPPPPKYEAMAPPSYEEVMGIHYPAYQAGQQPITQPLTHAIAQSSSSRETAPNNVTINVTNNVVRTDPPVTVSVTNEERRPSVTTRA